jgi:hypothetical protein
VERQLHIGEIKMRQQLIEASKEHFRSHINKHRMNIEVILNNPTAIHEHSDIMDAIEKEVAQIAEYHDKLEVMETYFK